MKAAHGRPCGASWFDKLTMKRSPTFRHTLEARGAMSKPFTGIRILDFTRLLAGPYASYQLALLGADVIKIEAPGGEDMRHGNRANDWEKRGLAAPWIAVNAGKRSLTLDLKKPRAIEAVKRLVAKS